MRQVALADNNINPFRLCMLPLWGVGSWLVVVFVVISTSSALVG